MATLTEKLKEFIEDFTQDKIRKYFVTEKKDKSNPFQITGGWLKDFMEQKDKLRIIMYYRSKDPGTEGIKIEFEETAEYFQGPNVIFGHIDVSKNDISPVLGYDADQITKLGKSRF